MGGVRINRGAMEFVVGTVRFRFDVNFLAGARTRRKVVERAQSMGMLPLGAIIPMDVRTRHGVVEFVPSTVPSRLDVNSQMGAKRK